ILFTGSYPRGLHRFVVGVRIHTDRPRLASALYAQAWSLFHFLYLERPEQLAGYLATAAELRPGRRPEPQRRQEFIDAFGIFINGQNVAEVEVDGELEPLNVNNSAMAEIPGTQLNAVIAPDGTPLLRFAVGVEHLNATDNELMFIIGDTSDADLDSTVYISGLTAEQEDPEFTIPGNIHGMAFRTSQSDPTERTLYVVADDVDDLARDATRLFRLDRDENGQTVGAADLGLIEIDGLNTNVRGISFDSDGRLIAQNNADGQTHRILVDLDDPTDSAYYSRPGASDADPDAIYALGGAAQGDQVLGVRNDAGGTQLYGFNAVPDRLVQINPDTGATSVVGEFTASDTGNRYFNSVDHIAFSPMVDFSRPEGGGTLYALLSDRDGGGTLNHFDDGAALAQIDFTAVDDGLLRAVNPGVTGSSFPALLDAGADPETVTPITDEFGGLAVASNGIVHAIQKVGGEDRLIEIDLTNTVSNGLQTTDLFAIELPDGADTDILGIGFDDQGRILAMNRTVDGNEIISINPADGTDVVHISARQILDSSLNAFAVDISGDPADTYAYDLTAGVGGTFYASPGVQNAPVLGQIDVNDLAADYRFLQALPLLDADGKLLGTSVADITVDEANNLVYTVTTDGRIFAHTADEGRFVQEFGQVVSDAGDGDLNIKSIEFDADAGQLIGVDARFNNIVRINLGSAANGLVTASATGETGTINAARIADMAYDAINGRMLGVTTAPNAVFGEFLDASETALGGITASSFNRVQITVPTPNDPDMPRDFDGRLVATGLGGFSNVSVDGNFTGSIVSAGEIRSMNIDGDFGGSLQAWRDVNSI
ncbi:MAG: hypothetical protein WD079_05805, partial [Phycisphaeraceae bacterium]